MIACRHSTAEFLRRLGAAAGAALVLALTVFAASPRLHGDLHCADHPPVDHRCAVELFAAGVTTACAPVAALPPTSAWHAQPAAVGEKIFLASPRYLRQPERGPPTLG
jgi:hypothetical protein